MQQKNLTSINRNIPMAIIFFVFPLMVSAQSGLLLMPKNHIVKQGFIYYPEGEQNKFRQLHFFKDYVNYFDVEKLKRIESLQNIDSISKTFNGAGRGAIWGAGAGCAGGMITALIFFSNWGDENGVIYDSEDEEGLNVTIKKEGWYVILGCAAAGIFIGTLAGLKDRLEKTIYKRNPAIDVFPGLSYLPNEQPVFTVNIHIHL